MIKHLLKNLSAYSLFKRHLKPFCLLVFYTTLCINITNAQCPYFTKISASHSGLFSLGIRNDGTLWGWGYNAQEEIGIGNITNQYTPVQIGTATNWTTITEGVNYSLAISSDGKLWSWGYNAYGQLGIGNTTEQIINPVQVGTATNWIAIAGGGSHSLAISSDGKLWAWGDNTYGQLGIGNTTSTNVPTQVGIATNWTAIAVGDNHSLAISSDGKLWAWGDNTYGQLGIGNTTQQTSPVQAGTDSNWTTIAAGYYHSFAISNDGKLWGWGYNGSGGLGIGNTTNTNVPTQVGTAAKWTTIAVGEEHCSAIDTSGKLWAWGQNSYGALGIGNTTAQHSPVQVGTATNWTAIAEGGSYSLAISSNDKLWAWGYNAYGQLGDETTTEQHSPENISAIPVYARLANDGSFGTKYQTDTTIYATDCLDLIANIQSNGTNPVTDSTTVTVWVDTTQPLTYVHRHYQIEPANNASTATGTVTLYFTQADFNSFNNQSPAPALALPRNSLDGGDIAHIKVEQRHGISSDNSGEPGSYPVGTAINITPTTIWNSLFNRWEVSFPVTGFSGFFLKTTPTVLPVSWLRFTGTINTAKQTVLNWQVTEQNASKYIIEKSIAVNNFYPIATINSLSTGTNSYVYTDSSVLNGTALYRIEEVDKDGSISYSTIVSLSNTNNQSQPIIVYPNPTKNSVTVTELKGKIELRVISPVGQELQTIQTNNSTKQIDLGNYPVGIYILQVFEDGALVNNIKINKE